MFLMMLLMTLLLMLLEAHFQQTDAGQGLGREFCSLAIFRKQQFTFKLQFFWVPCEA